MWSRGSEVRGVSLKTWPFDFCLIYMATSTPEGWYIFHLKGEIHSSVWSTKTFLYFFREPRYKQNNMGYQISRIWNYEQSWNLIPAWFMVNFSSYELFRGLGQIPFWRWHLYACFKIKPISVQHKGAKI